MCKKILTNSELPLCLLERNVELNGMDFVLFHLYSSNKTYREYYQQLRLEHPERVMILDNSAYEFYVLGQKLDWVGFVEAINELKPNMYLLPDTLMDAEKTIRDSWKFLVMNIIKINPQSQPMAVPQGVLVEEMIDCLHKYQKWGIKNIALPFHNSFYKEMASPYASRWIDNFSIFTGDMQYASGRCQFIHQYQKDLQEFSYIHLLGSHSPWEKKVIASEMPIIDSMDTGYPVKVGYEGYELFQEPKKPEIIIDQFLEENLQEDVKRRICGNVRIFSQL